MLVARKVKRHRISSFAMVGGARLLLSVVGLLIAAEAAGQMTQEELRALPRICHAQRFINSALDSPIVPEAERRMWEAKLGEPFMSFHHFCWGLIDMRRAAATRDPGRRNTHYRNAVQNFQYVERNSDATFPLLPEVLLRKGMALQLLGDPASAASQFLAAVKIKRDYTPAYAALIDVYVELEDIEAANETLAEGLSHAPSSRILATKKTELEERKSEP